MGRDDNLWFCSNCRSGPIGIWQDNCPLCGAARLEYISYRLAEPDKLEAQIAKERKATVQGSLKPQKARQSIPRPATELRRQILATFGTANPKITVEDVVKVTLTMEWDPVQFYEDCFSSVEYNVFAQEAIVFTGTERNAEATTVSKYIARNWPHLKDVILRALQSLKDPKFGLNGRRLQYALEHQLTTKLENQSSSELHQACKHRDFPCYCLVIDSSTHVSQYAATWTG